MPAFLQKYLTHGSITSTNKQSENDDFRMFDSNNTIGFKPNKAASVVKNLDQRLSQSKLGLQPGQNQFGTVSYYSHEDTMGAKVEFRNPKIIPLQEAKADDEESSGGDTVTTPISSSQMKSEFRDKV